MEQFRTELPITPAPLIHHGSVILTTGSCFSDNIGQKLSESKFRTIVNPLGTSYNPLSIHKGLMSNEPDADLYIESEDMWRHFDFHSRFSATSRSELREALIQQLRSEFFDTLIITYGTSWVYKHKATSEIVSNCHKRPQHEFEKVLLSVDDIVNSFAELRRCTDQKIILTLSPVRHIKDTLEKNSVSKSTIRIAIYKILNEFSDVEYFPAYEIMMDDLRDYRFYDADMIHPSGVAIDYIWKKFRERYFSKETQEIVERWSLVKKSLNHRAFNPGSRKHRDFLKSVLSELNALKTKIDVDTEIEMVERRLHE
jgi:hypothetical protein